MWDETHDAQKSQGWTAFVLDTNGNGKRDEYTEPAHPLQLLARLLRPAPPASPCDPTKDMRIKVGFYGVSREARRTATIWGTVLGFPGSIVRLVPGSDPAHTSLAEIYELPWKNPKAPVPGILAARHGHHPRRRHLDRAFERSLRQL